MPLQEDIALEERIPAAQSPVQSENHSKNESKHQQPVRERQPPRVFTYDQLGHPSCCGIGFPEVMMYYHPPASYGPMQAASTWTAPVQHWNYQPAVAQSY